MRWIQWCVLMGSMVPAQAQLLFDHVTTNDGLPGNEVLCVHEDRSGFVWAGTRTGLARLEGTRVRTFFHDRSDSSSLAHDQVNAVGEDAKGRLWFATMSGLSLYDPVSGGFRSYRIAAEGSAAHLANRMVQIVCVGDTLLWVTTGDGLHRFDPRRSTFTKAPTTIPGEGPPDAIMNSAELHWDDHRRGMWVGGDGGLAFWDARSDSWKDHRNAQEPWFHLLHAHVPWVQHRDTLWTFTSNDYALHGWHLPTRTTWRVDSMAGARNHFTAHWQAMDPQGRHWLSTWTHRLYVCPNGGDWKEVKPSTTAPAALRSGHVNASCTARKGDRWFATDRGLAVLRTESERLALVRVNGMEGGVSELMLLGGDTLLIGGHGDGVVALRLSTGEQRQARVQRPLLPEEDRQWSDYIVGFTRDQRGRLLASTMGMLLEVDIKNMRLIELPDLLGRTLKGRFRRHATFLEPDGDHHLLVGTWSHGVLRTDLRDGTHAASDERGGPLGPLADDGALCFLRDSRGQCWLGLNDGGGLMRLESGTFRAVKEAGGGNLGGVVRCMTEGPDGALWLGTHEEGLLRYDPTSGASRQFGRRNGLPGVRIGHVFFDRSETLWACTDRGIAYLRAGSDQFRVLSLPAGLDPESLANAGLQLPDGRLVFGVGEHAMLLDPRIGLEGVGELGTRITGIDINGTRFRDALPSWMIEVREDGRALSFDLAVVGAPPRAAPLFRFRTDSSLAWVALGTAPRLDLFDLPTGQHSLQIQSSINGVDWSEANTLPITVAPLPHRTVWFRTLMALLIAGAVALMVWLYVQARLRKQRIAFEQEQAVLQERMRIAGDMHDDLGAGLSALKLRSEMALRVEKDPAKRDQLGSLARSAGELIGSMRQIIWTMNDDQGSLADLVVYTGNYARTYCAENGLRPEVVVDPQWPDIQLSSEQRRSVFLVVKEALHNVVKHAGAHTVRLVMHCDGDRLGVAVQDDGVGLPAQADRSIGNGLRNMRKRITALGGNLVLTQPGSGRGAVIQAEIPLGPIANKGSIAGVISERNLRTE